MKSNKQRRTEIKAKRVTRRKTTPPAAPQLPLGELDTGHAPVNVTALKPYNSYGVPRFVERGYYVDSRFQCADCGQIEIWTATQQKWWYEVAQGYVYSTAKRCRPCRRREQARRSGPKRHKPKK